MDEDTPNQSKIQNAEARYKEHAEGRLLSTQLQKRTKKNKGESESFGSMQDASEAIQSERKEVHQSLSDKGSAIQKVVKKGLVKKRVSSGVIWTGITIAFTSYLWQALFGLLSLVFFYGGGVVKTTWWAGWINSFLGVLESAEAVGLALWGLAFLIVFFTFFGFFILYKALGVDPIGTMVSTIITFLALALSIIPVGNLFPFLLLWVLYMSARLLKE